MPKAKDTLQKRLQQFSSKKFEAVGRIGNFNGQIKVPNRTNFVYVRINESQVVEVFNTRVPLQFNLPVIIGYSDKEPTLLQVLSYFKDSYFEEDAQKILQVPQHGASHEWFGRDGGQDVVFVQHRQIRPLRPVTLGTYEVLVERGIVNINGEWLYVSGQSVDLEGYIPTSGAKQVLLYVDEDGLVKVLEGDVGTLSGLTLKDIPQPLAGTYPVGGIRLYAGQSYIQETRTISDITDLRFAGLTTSIISGSSSGGTTIHNNLTGRNVSGTHPASSIGTDVSEFSELLVTGTNVQSSLAILDTHSHDFVVPHGSSEPASATNGQLFINSSTNELEVFWCGVWQAIITLVCAGNFLLQENGSYILQENGDKIKLEQE